MTRKRHPQMITVCKEDLDSFLACLEACLHRAEQLAAHFECLEVEPGGPDLWHVPQVGAITPWSDQEQ